MIFNDFINFLAYFIDFYCFQLILWLLFSLFLAIGMKTRFLFVFSLLLSVGVLASSTVFVLEDNTAVRSSKSDKNTNNILKVVNKDQQLQRLTMHYSGWSLVKIDNINGWIPSTVLTDVVPNKLAESANSNNPSKEVSHKVKDLSSKLSEANRKLKDLQVSYEKSNNTIAKLTANLERLTLENSHLLKTQVKVSQEKKNEQKSNSIEQSEPAFVNNETSQVDHSTTTPLNMNWIYGAAGGVFSLLVLLIFSIYNRNKRRHFDLNTLRR